MPPLSPDPNNPYVSLLNSQNQGALTNYVGALDSDPDEAARAVQLGQATGVSPSVVNIDNEAFERELKIHAGSQIIRQNPYLEAYLNSDPIAAKVSHDDLDNLDVLSAAMQRHNKDSVLVNAIKGFAEGFGPGGLGSWISPEAKAEHPLLSAEYSVLGSPIEGAFRFLGGLTTGAIRGVEAGARQVGVHPDTAKDLADRAIETVGDPGLWASLGPAGEAIGLPLAAAAHNAMLREAAKVEPYIRDGKVPPPGVSPIVDEAHRAQAETDKANLAEALKEATSTQTRERSPELLKEFLDKHVGDQHIGINPDAVRALYGDKPPQPEDGLLGWVPRIQEQLEASATTGADIQVPLSDWVAKVEPEVAKGLEDHIRVRPEGMTPEEAKEPISYPAGEEEAGTLSHMAGIKDAQPTPESTTRAQQLALALPDTTPLDAREEFAKANAIGMTVEQYRGYRALIEQRALEKIAAISEQALKAERRQQTAEWKDNRKSVRTEVASEIITRPDHVVDEALRKGDVKLRAESLTDEDKAALPNEWIRSDGLNPDDLASMFGVDNGRGVVDQLKTLVAQREASGMRPEEFKRRLIDAETDRQMEARYGNLDKNIVAEAKDQVLSETQQQLLHEETLARAAEAGLQFPISKGELEGAIRQAFDRTPVRAVDSDRFMVNAGKAGRAAEMALLKGDAAEAFRQKQRQYMSFVAARLARQFEKIKTQFEKNAKRFSAREVSGVEQEYTNWIHDLLVRTGNPVKRSIQDLQESLGRGEQKTLADFVTYKQGHDLREVPVADFLLDPDYRAKTEDMSTEEFKDLHDSVRTLIKNGRDERKITKAGEEADLAEVKAKMIEQLATFKEKHYDASGGRPLGPLPPRVGNGVRTYVAAHLKLETLTRRWDHEDPKGVFTQYVSRDLATAANFEEALKREYAKKYKALKDDVDLKERIPNPIFRDPLTIDTPAGAGPARGSMMPMTRENLRAVLLNVGNAINLDKLARGYKLSPEVIMNWLNTHAKKEDWDFAQKLGDLFAEIKAKSDVMYRNLSGLEPENIPVTPVQTPHGEYKGWYYPLIYDPIREGASKKLMGKDALEGENYIRATPQAGYTKQRTGYVAPLALHADMIPSRIEGMLHDVAMRPAIINASKIFYDHDVRNAITRYFGSEFKDQLVPYLQDVANSAGGRSNAQAVGNRVLEMLRQNLISTLIGINPGTVFKHGPTALINSISEVGAKQFLEAVVGLLSKDESTGESNWRFAMDTSEELQRRRRNWTETLGGAHSELVPRGALGSLRQTLIQLGAKPVAASDLLSAVPTWLAKYKAEMEEHGIHGDAVYEADRAVRRAHGSTVVTDRPEIMRRGNTWFTSLYGFFNHIMNRQVELVWKASDTLDLAKAGQYEAAAKNIPQLTSMLFSYVIFPALVEEMVTGLPDEKKQGLITKSVKGLVWTLSSSWVLVRDVASAALAGRDPTGGLTGTFGKSLTDMYRDLGKDHPLNKAHAGNIIKHSAVAIGALTGMTNAQEGKTGKFIYEYATGQSHPHTLPDWYRGLRYGSTKER